VRTDPTLVSVNVSAGQGTLATAEITFEGNGIHVEATAPGGSLVDVCSEELLAKNMLHGPVDLGVIFDASGDHRRNIGCIGVGNIIHLEAIQAER
jgi:hypothetical protein